MTITGHWLYKIVFVSFDFKFSFGKQQRLFNIDIGNVTNYMGLQKLEGLPSRKCKYPNITLTTSVLQILTSYQTTFIRTPAIACLCILSSFARMFYLLVFHSVFFVLFLLFGNIICFCFVWTILNQGAFMVDCTVIC